MIKLLRARKVHRFNGLREKNRFRTIRFFNRNTCANLSNANLSGANFSHANIIHTEFSQGVDLSNLDMSYAKIHSVNLSNANLHSANLSNAEIFGSNFTNSDMSYAKMPRHQDIQYEYNRTDRRCQFLWSKSFT